MKQSTAYLWLCVIGIVAPWFFLGGFWAQPHPTVALFFSSIFANAVASAVAADLLVSAFVFFTFVFFEGKRLNMKRLWVFIPATLFVGLSFGLPLFLYFRAKHIAKNSQPYAQAGCEREQVTYKKRGIWWTIAVVTILVAGFKAPAYFIDNGISQFPTEMEREVAANSIRSSYMASEGLGALIIRAYRVTSVSLASEPCDGSPNMFKPAGKYASQVQLYTIFGLPYETIYLTCGGDGWTLGRFWKSNRHN